MNDLSTATIALLTSQTDEDRQWVHLMPNGSFTGMDGRGPYDARDTAGIIAATLKHAGGRPIPLDYDHQIDRGVPQGMTAPAAGWIESLQAREDGIWGKVEWTPRAKAALAAREYRYISPVMRHTPNGRVTHILRASITNNPNLSELTALNSAGKHMIEDDFISTLNELLSLPAGSKYENIVEATRELVTSKNSVDPAKYVPIALFQEAVMVANQANSGISRQSAEIAVDQAEKDRKLMPFMRDWAVSLCMANKPAYDSFMEKISPSIHTFLVDLGSPAVRGKYPSASDGGDTGDIQDEISRNLGLSKDDIKKYGATRR